MTIWFYVKTTDNPTVVGQTVCDYNFFQGLHPDDQYSYVLEKERIPMANIGKSRASMQPEKSSFPLPWFTSRETLSL